jgi:hypothetical protein
VASGGGYRASRGSARTRGFAAPAFTGCAFVVGLATLTYRIVRRLSSEQRGWSVRVFDPDAAVDWQEPRAVLPGLREDIIPQLVQTLNR